MTRWLIILIIASPIAMAANLESPDGVTTQPADKPPKSFSSERWEFACVETNPQTGLYLCRYFDKRESQ